MQSSTRDSGVNDNCKTHQVSLFRHAKESSKWVGEHFVCMNGNESIGRRQILPGDRRQTNLINWPRFVDRGKM